MPLGYSTYDRNGNLVFYTNEGKQVRSAIKKLTPDLELDYPLVKEQDTQEHTAKFYPDVPEPVKKGGLTKPVMYSGVAGQPLPSEEERDWEEQKSYGVAGEGLDITPSEKIRKQEELITGLGESFDEFNKRNKPEMEATGGDEFGLSGGEDAFGKMIAGTNEYANALAKSQDEMTTKYKASLDALAEFDKKTQDEEIAKNQEIDAKMQDFESSVAQYSQMEPSVSNYWKSRGGWQKALAGISIALGAAGQAMGEKSNQALDIITDSIDKDIDLQKFEIDKKGKELGVQHNILSDMHDRFKDWRIAKQATRITMLDGVERQIKLIEMQSQSKLTKAKAQMSIGEILQKKNEYKLEMVKLMATIQSKGDVRERMVPMSDGSYQVALTEKDATDAKKFNFAMSGIMDDLKELKTIRNKYGAEFTNRNIVNRASNFSMSAKMQIKELYGLGVLSDREYERMDKMIPTDPTEIGFVMSKLDALEDELKSKNIAFYKSRGLKSYSSQSEKLTE